MSAVADEITLPVNFAEVVSIFEDGIQLRLDGEESPTQKHYQVVRTYFPKVKDRVYIVRLSGTVLVVGPVGGPQEKGIIPYADEAGHAELADDAATLDGKNAAALSVKYAKEAEIAKTAEVAESADTLNKVEPQNLKVSTARYFTEEHRGNTLAFFNARAVGKRSVMELYAGATPEQVRSKVIEIYAALNSYGLI